MGYATGVHWNYELVKQFVEKLGYILISEKYINARTKLILMDKYSYYYMITLSDLKSGANPYMVSTSNPYTIQNIRLWCKLNNKPFELVSEIYEKIKIKLKWKCFKKDCEEIFEASWDNILHNKGCSYCSGKKVGLSNCLAIKNPELASEWHPIKNGDLTPYDVTCGINKEVWWRCKKNPKHEWKSSINSRNSGVGCPYCIKQHGGYTLPSEEYNLLINNPKLCEEWNYEKNDKLPNEYTPSSGQKVWWQCKECGYEWKISIDKRNGKEKTNCPQCNESKGEKQINEFLSVNKKINILQKSFEGLVGLGNGLLSYDFYLPEDNLLIEYQGKQHEKYIPGLHKSKKDFERQLEHDKRKRMYAQNNNMKLLEIWYWDFDNIEEILNENIKNW